MSPGRAGSSSDPRRPGQGPDRIRAPDRAPRRRAARGRPRAVARPPPRGRPRAARHLRSLLLGGVEIDGEPFGRTVRVRSAATIRVNGREYVGDFEVATTGDGFAVINELPLEPYVAGALKAEAPATWPREALRAQAIVVRTYAAYQRQLNAGRAYHIVASTADQQYAGRVGDASPVWDAVRDTAGQVLLWEGGLFAALYRA